MTLNEIAQMAGVAKSTVSRYLNNGSVSEQTKIKIQKIIDETGYVPNQFAQSLKSQRSNMMGVVLPRFDSPSSNQVLKGIDELAYQEGYQLVLTNSNLDIQRQKENIALLERQKVGGIIFIASLMDESLMEQLRQVKIPLLVVGQEIEGVPSLIHQDFQASQQIADHVIELGHKRVLFVGVTEEDKAVGITRRQGFMERVKEKDIQVDFVETTFSRRDAYEKALEFLPSMQATYVVAATDHIAIGISSAAAQLGLSIPKDFSLSGFGGYSESDYVFPAITTVDYPFYESGTQAFNLLKQLMAGDEVAQLNEIANHLNLKQSTQAYQAQ